MNIEVTNLSASYKKELVLSSLNFSVKSGEMLAIIGPNGAGKSTLMKILLGLKETDSGSVLIDGQAPKQYLKQNKGSIAYLPQQYQLNHLLPLSVRDVLSQMIKAQKSWREVISTEEWTRIHYAFDLLQISVPMDELFINLSGGQRQKVLIAATLVTNPKFLFLDEPTNTLDSQSIQHLYHVLEQLVADGVGVFMISHDISSIVSRSHKLGILRKELLYFGAVAGVSEAMVHDVFGAHIKITTDDKNCVLCQSLKA